MRIICAPDSFKESLSAREAAQAMARGVEQALGDAQVDQCPIADGGEGTVEAMLAAMGGSARVTRVTGPRGESVEARWGLVPGSLPSGGCGGSPEVMRHQGTVEPEDRGVADFRGAAPATPPDQSRGPMAVLEMAAASGLPLVPAGQRDPTRTTTYGTGELIAAALAQGVDRILLGIGGSATNDGGCGMAQALGVRFYDFDERLIEKPMIGAWLDRVGRIDVSGLDPRLGRTRIDVACDVTNPLTGSHGAARIYGPQKGAGPEQIEQLDRGLVHLAAVWQRQDGEDLSNVPGSGAAGGLGFGLVAFLGARLVRGIDLVLDATQFHHRVRGCDLCLTGEGKLDGSSLQGKACMGVTRAAASCGVPVIALVGSTGPGYEQALEEGLVAVHSISAGRFVEESIRRAASLLEAKTAEVVRGWAAR